MSRCGSARPSRFGMDHVVVRSCQRSQAALGPLPLKRTRLRQGSRRSRERCATRCRLRPTPCRQWWVVSSSHPTPEYLRAYPHRPGPTDTDRSAAKRTASTRVTQRGRLISGCRRSAMHPPLRDHIPLPALFNFAHCPDFKCECPTGKQPQLGRDLGDACWGRRLLGTQSAEMRPAYAISDHKGRIASIRFPTINQKNPTIHSPDRRGA